MVACYRRDARIRQHKNYGNLQFPPITFYLNNCRHNKNIYSTNSKFADDCGAAAQESKLVEKNNSNSRQFLTFVVVRKNRSVEEVNLSTFQNGVYKLFRTSPT